MNEKLLQTIKNYLQQDTHSALMITGEWGSGKTHFIKNDSAFKNYIDVYSPGKETLYVSLNGLSVVI